MGTDVEIDRALATVAATINDQGLASFDTKRVQHVVTEALGGEPLFPGRLLLRRLLPVPLRRRRAGYVRISSLALPVLADAGELIAHPF